jgi:hypothetical protein
MRIKSREEKERYAKMQKRNKLEVSQEGERRGKVLTKPKLTCSWYVRLSGLLGVGPGTRDLGCRELHPD